VFLILDFTTPFRYTMNRCSDPVPKQFKVWTPAGHTFQGSLNWQLFPCWWICRPIDNSLSIPSTFADSPIWENAGVAFIIPFLSWIPQNVEVKTDQLCPASVTPYSLHSPSSSLALQLDLLTVPTWPHRVSMLQSHQLVLPPRIKLVNFVRIGYQHPSF